MFYIIQTIKRTFILSGRATRKEYIYFILFGYVIMLLAKLLPLIVLGEEKLLERMLSGNINYAYVIITLTILLKIPEISLIVRRLHDANFSGWWFWLVTIYYPIIYTIIAFLSIDFSNSKFTSSSHLYEVSDALLSNLARNFTSFMVKIGLKKHFDRVLNEN